MRTEYWTFGTIGSPASVCGGVRESAPAATGNDCVPRVEMIVIVQPRA
jgi:hypothetical protein